MGADPVTGLHIFTTPLLSARELRNSIQWIAEVKSLEKIESEKRHFNAKLRKSFFRHYPLFRNLIGVIGRREFRDFINTNFKRPVVHHVDILVKDAQAPETFFHQDRPYWAKFDNPPSMKTVWIPLIDVNPMNGCLRIVDGGCMEALLPHVRRSHSADADQLVVDDTEEGKCRKSAIDVTLMAGQGVSFESFVIHGAHPNSSAEARYAFKFAIGEEASLNRRYLFRIYGVKWRISRLFRHLPLFIRLTRGKSTAKG
jgi:hypothetical protein